MSDHTEPEAADIESLIKGHGTHVWLMHLKKPSGQNPLIINIIKRYLSGDFKIVKNTNGKPLIESNFHKELHISITHSGPIMALALSFEHALGIDLEILKERAHMDRLRRRYFPEPTPTILDFYQAWTAREAFIKSLGGRLFTLIDKIHLSHIDNKCLIGLHNYSHQVFFHQWDNFLLAICLDKSADKYLKYFYI